MTGGRSRPAPIDLADPDAAIAGGSVAERRLRDVLSLGASYFALALLAIHLSCQPGSIATVWFANAVGIAYLASRPTRCWAELLSVTIAANFVANLTYGDPVALSASFLPANALEVLVGGLLVRRGGGVEHFADGAGSFIGVLVKGALLAPLVGATVGAAIIHWHGFATFGDTWDNWYIGSLLGSVATLPFALAALKRGAPLVRLQLFTLPTAAFALLCMSVAYLALRWLHFPFVYLTLPLIGAALLLSSLAAFGLALLVVLVVAAAIAFEFVDPIFPVADWRHMLFYVAAVAAIVPPQLLAVVAGRQRSTARALFALTSATSELVAFVDTRWVYRLVNRAHELYFNNRRGAMVGRHVSQVIPEPRYGELVAPALRRALAGETVQYRSVIDYAGVGVRTMEFTYQPAFDEHEHQVGVVVNAHDMTELASAQAELERRLAELRDVNESLEQFVRMASHDLREPLNTMVQFSALIRDDHGHELSTSARAYLEHVCSGSLRLRTMLDDVLSFARLDPSQRVVLEPLALEHVVAQALGSLQAAVSGCSARVEVLPMPGVLGHDTLLTMLFQNVISNAIKFVPAGRTPQVVVSATGNAAGAVVVSIVDNGIGIAAEHLPLLFEPFKRLHSRRRFEGTGLGLAICRRIAAAHGGSIEIDSAPDRGSRVRVTLQRAA